MWRGERDKGLWRKDERGEYIVCARDLQRKPAPSAYKGGNYAAQPSASSEINVYTLISREAHAWCAVLTRSEGLSFATLSPPLLTATKKPDFRQNEKPFFARRRRGKATRVIFPRVASPSLRVALARTTPQRITQLYLCCGRCGIFVVPPLPP